MKKTVAHIRRKRLDRWFWGIFNDKLPGIEAWTEGGHLISGVVIDLASVNETNGIKRFAPRLGYFVDGEMEHAQNTIGDMKEIVPLDGTLNFAFLCNNQLEIFRKYKDGDSYIDNRISFQTSGAAYGEAREHMKSKLSGFIRIYEKYLVRPESVKIAGGKLKFDPVLDSLFSISAVKKTTGSGDK